MEWERTTIGEVDLFRIRGRLDSSTSPVLESALLPMIKSGGSRMVLDFTGVEYVSSAGLRVVLLAAKQTRAVQGAFAIFGMAKSILHVFQMSGFARIIPLFDSEAAALAAVSTTT